MTGQGGAVSGHARSLLAYAASKLHREHPSWDITTTQGRDGPRLDARRPRPSGGGVTVVITGDADELRKLLDEADKEPP